MRRTMLWLCLVGCVLMAAGTAAAETIYKVWTKPVSSLSLPVFPVPPGAAAPPAEYSKCDRGDCGVNIAKYWNIKDPSGQQPFYYWSAQIQITTYTPSPDGVDNNLAFVDPAKHGTVTERMKYNNHDGAIKTTTNVFQPAPAGFRKKGLSPAYSSAFTIRWEDASEVEYVEQTQVRVSNLQILAAFSFHGSPGARKSVTFPSTKVLVDSILRQVEIASGMPPEPAAAEPKKPEATPEREYNPELLTYPFRGTSATDICLIPASERLPAKFVVRGAKPNAPIEIALPDAARGYLVWNDQRARRITGKTDAQGGAEVWYHYTPGKTPLTAPERYEIPLTAGGRLLRATVHVGLGIVPSAIQGLQASTVREASRENTFVIALGVRSAFQPGLNLIAYLENATRSGLWKRNRVGMKLVANWLNRDGATAPDEFYNGSVNLTALPDGKTILTANERPWYTAPLGRFFYPAVVMGEDGKHVYQIAIRGAILDDTAGGKGGFVEYLDEQPSLQPVLLTFSREQPESVLTSLSCSFNAATDYQYLMLETVKALPGWKQEVDTFLTATSLVCGLLKGNTEQSLIDLAAWTGGKVLDHLTKPEVLQTFTVRQQEAIKQAKGAYDKLDKERKKREIKELRTAEGSIGIPPEVFDIPIGGSVSEAGLKAEPAAGGVGAAPKGSSSPWAKPEAPAVSPSNAKPLNESVQDLKRSLDDLGTTLNDAFKGLFK